MYWRSTLIAAIWLLVATSVQADDGIAISALRDAGATVERDGSKDGKPVVHVEYYLRDVNATGNRALKEIEELPSIEFLGSGDTGMTATTLRALQGKKSLKKLAIANAKINDDAARALGALTQLESLDLHAQVEMRPEGLKEIFQLTNLKELIVADRIVSDALLQELTRFTALKSLSIRSVFVTDRGIQSLRRLPNLHTLRLFIGPRITEEGIRQLAEVSVTDLDLTYTNVTDAKLRGLRNLNGLKSLRLVNATGVTDEGVPSLMELKELKQLDLANAKLTTNGLRQLKGAIPRCSIKYDSQKRDVLSSNGD
jgi:hypothetical protein